MKPCVAIIYTEGINREQESINAWQKAGAKTELVYLVELQEKEKKLENYQIILFPGGFSYGDDVLSAKIWAAKSLAYFQEQMEKFVNEDKLIMGICNGFQYLTRTGLLPFQNVGKIEATLTDNESGHFESRWVNMKIQKSNCVFTQGMEEKILRMPTAHGEGRFIVPQKNLQKLETQNQVVFRYVDKNGQATQKYPANPNGSTNAIAGICSPNGKIFGLMPHPECNIKFNHHPNWNEEGQEGGECLEIFENAVRYFG